MSATPSVSESRTCGDLFSRLHALLRKEMLFVASERSAIKELRQTIEAKGAQLQALTLEARSLSKMADTVVNRGYNGDWTEDEVNITVIPNANAFGSKQFEYGTMLEIIKTNASYLAKGLSKLPAKGQDLDAIAQAIVLGVFGSYFRPQEERVLLYVMKRTLELQLETSPQAKSFLRQTTVSLKLVQAYNKNFTTGKLYLIAALRDPILAVISDLSLNLEVQPEKVYQSLSPSEREQLGSLNLRDVDATMQHPVMQKALHAIYEKTVELATLFVKSIEEQLSVLPYGIRWIAKQIKAFAMTCTPPLHESDLNCLLGDLIFFRFINPAIVNPESHGVVTDTPIAPLARRNLILLAKVLQAVARGNVQEIAREQYMTPLLDRLGSVETSSFFRKLVEVGEPEECIVSPPDEDLNKARIPNVILSMNEMYSVHDIVASVREGLSSTDPIVPVLDRLGAIPEKLAPGSQNFSTYHTLRVGSSNDPFSLLSEDDVVPKDTGAKEVVAVKRRLRLVIGNLEFSYVFRNRTITQILKQELEIAGASQKRALTAQLQETLKVMGQLPPTFSSPDFAPILSMMLEDYERRDQYRIYLSQLRQDLVLVVDNLDRCIGLVEKDKRIYLDCKKQVIVRAFLEKAEQKFESFETRFRSLPRSEEKALAVQEFLDEMAQDLSQDTLWRTVSYNEQGDGAVMLGKFLMTRLFDAAFYPTADRGSEKSASFQALATKLQAKVTTLPALAVPEHSMGEAPWMLAQQELLKINRYKDPGDKMQVIMNAAKIVMELLSLAGKVVGADDFFPVFVYVVLHANPPNAELNIQYIEAFYRDGSLPGEASYWFIQFTSAVQFIRSLESSA